MKLLLKIVALLTSLLFGISGVQQATVGFTGEKPLQVTQREYCFDRDKLLIGAYYGVVNGNSFDETTLDLAKQAGIEFFIESSVSENLLDKCAERNIGIIAGGYNLPRAYGSVGEGTVAAWTQPGYPNYRDHVALWGDDLIDEPGASVYKKLNDCITAYHRNTSKKFGYINLFPAYADNEQLQEESTMSLLQKILLSGTGMGTESLERFKKYVADYVATIDVDYICYDVYPYSSRQSASGKEIKTTNEEWLRSLDILAAACRDTNRDLWVITQASGKTKKGEPVPADDNPDVMVNSNPRFCDEKSDISQQAYASLAFGAKAIIHAQFAPKGWWAPGESHMIGSDGKPTETYTAVKAVDDDLAAFASVYGDYGYTGTYLVNSLKCAGVKGCMLETTVPEKAINVISANGLLVGTFDGIKAADGNAYIITNMEELNKNATASCILKVPADKTMTVYQQGKTTTFTSGETVKLTFEPGEGIFATVK